MRTNIGIKLYVFYSSIRIFAFFIIFVFVLVINFVSHNLELVLAQEATIPTPQIGFNITDSSTPTSFCTNVNSDITDITASGSQQDNNYMNVRDGNLASRWSNKGVDSWIQIDLNNSHMICSIDIAWYKGNERSYRFVISVANETGPYTSVFIGRSSGKTSEPEPYNITDINGRYVEITINGNTVHKPSSANFAAITEIDIYGYSMEDNMSPSVTYQTQNIMAASPATNQTQFNNTTAASPAHNNGGMLGLKPAISISNDKIKYAPGQVIRIFGTVINGAAEPIDANVLLKITKTHNSNFLGGYDPVIKESEQERPKALLLAKDGNYSHSIINTDSGKYSLYANTFYNGTLAENWATFEVLNLYYSLPFYLIVGAIISFIALVVTATKFDNTKSYMYELYRFICISGIALSPLVAFVFTDIEIGANSIVGLVTKYQFDQNGNLRLDKNGQPVGEWVINVGGNSISNYQSGIQFPFFVFAFGIIGGYLRYLFKTFSKGGVREGDDDEFYIRENNALDKDLELEEKVKKNYPAKAEKILTSIRRKRFMRETLSEVAELSLAPVLAIAAYFLIYQGTTPNIYTISIVSFAVGLITKDIVAILENVVRRNIRTAANEEATSKVGGTHPPAGVS